MPGTASIVIFDEVAPTEQVDKGPEAVVSSQRQGKLAILALPQAVLNHTCTGVGGGHKLQPVASSRDYEFDIHR